MPTGSRTITLLGKIGREVSEFQVGQYIVLEGLRTWKDFDDDIDINGEASIGTVVYNGNDNSNNDGGDDDDFGSKFRFRLIDFTWK